MASNETSARRPAPSLQKESTTAVDPAVGNFVDSVRAPELSEKEQFEEEYASKMSDDPIGFIVHQPIPGLDYREISVKDWERAGVQDGRYVRWDPSNEWRLPIGMMDFLSEGQLDSFLRGDRRFSVVEDVEP